MMKFLKKKLLLKIFTTAIMLSVWTGWSQGHETFENISGSSSAYTTRTWTGNDNIEWIATDARTSISSNYQINGKGIGIREGYLENTTEITGGIGTLTFKYKRFFSGVDPEGIKVYVNDVQYGETLYPPSSGYDTQTYSEVVNVSGNVTIRIDYSTYTKRIVIDDVEWTAYVTTPEVTTNSTVTNATTNSATISGEVTSQGASNVTARGFVWSSSVTIPTLELNDDSSSNGTGTGTFSEDITGLTQGTTYYFRAYATNNEGTAYGNVQTFSTQSIVTPIVFTTTVDEQNDVDSSFAIISGGVTNNGNATITEKGFVYNTTGTNLNLGETTTVTNADTDNSSFSEIIEDLNANTQYYFRAYATNSIGTGYGSTKSFYTYATTPLAPSITNPTTNSLDISVNDNGASLYSITVLGGIIDGYLNTNGTISETPVWANASSWIDVTLNDLTPETTYLFSVNAQNASGIETGEGTTAEGTTAEAVNPYLIPVENSLNFGDICITASNNTGYITFSGENFSSPTTLTISSGTSDGADGYENLNGFSFGIEGETFTSGSYTLNDFDGSEVTIQVHFYPTLEQDYSLEDILITYDNGSNIVELYTFDIVNARGINTAGTVTTGGVISTDLFKATLAGQAVEACTTFTEYGIEYSTIENFTDGTGTIATSNNISSNNYTADVTGLEPCTTYYYKAYATDSAGTHYGTQQSFTTSELGTPTAITATEISNSSFTANWEAEEGATSYILEISTSPNFITESYADDLFISEYIEGSSNNKYLEIFNGTGEDVNLANYSIRIYYNGNSSYGTNINLSGTLTNGNVVVYRNSSASIHGAISTIANSNINFNGDDAVVLYNNNTNSIIDIFGEIGDDPGSGWNVGGKFTANYTLVRNSNVMGGVTTNTSNFPTLGTEWASYTTNTVSNLGNHDFDGGLISDIIEGYENLNVGDVTSYEVTGLDAGTDYYYRVRAVTNGCTSSNSNTINVTTGAQNVWNGTEWTAGSAPDSIDAAIIEGAYNTTDDGSFSAATLTVNSGGSITVTSGTTLTITDAIVNNAGAENFIVEDNANLIQTNDVANTGDITVYKNSSPLYRLDYTMWSSPVSGQNLQEFSPQTLSNRFYTYNETTDYYNSIDPSLTDFAQGLGYLIRMPNTHPDFVDAGTPGTAWTGTFTGEPNNGDIAVNMSTTLNGYNLVGNPYPSPINIHDFYTANAGTINPGSALYLWRKRNDNEASTYAMLTMAAYTANSQTGGFGDTGSGIFTGDASAWVINPGQGFIVQATGNTLVFNNSMRRGVNNGQFFRMNQENTPSIDISRLWLNITGNNGEFNQMAIAYSAATTNGLDYGWDGKMLENNDDVKLFSTVDETKLSIQARATFTATDVVTVGYKAENAGSYTISLDHVDGLFEEGQQIYLTDKVLSTTHSLTEGGDYNFSTESGIFNDRFEVTYTMEALNTATPVLDANQVVVYKEGNNVMIDAGTAGINSLNVYDIKGRLLYNANNINTTTTVVNLNIAQQVIIIEISTDKGTVNKKVVF